MGSNVCYMYFFLKFQWRIWKFLSNKQAIYVLFEKFYISYAFTCWLKQSVNSAKRSPNVSLQSFNLYSLVSTYVRDNNLSLEMILLPTQTLVLYLISDCNILWRMFDETNRCFIWFANKSTEWFDCRKISYQNSPDALTHRLWGDILIDMYFIQYYLLTYNY